MNLNLHLIQIIWIYNELNKFNGKVDLIFWNFFFTDV